jgi:hypothetical protein
MGWVTKRAVLLGAGALAVAAIAAGVALAATRSSSHHARVGALLRAYGLFGDRPFLRGFGGPAAGPMMAGPFGPGLAAPGQRVGPGGPLGSFAPLGGIGFGDLGVLHAQLTVPAPGGKYQTVDIQRGSVTRVSATSITLRSPDGYVASYAVAPATVVAAQSRGIGSVHTGDVVMLRATVAGGKATVVRLVDLSRLRPRAALAR